MRVKQSQRRSFSLPQLSLRKRFALGLGAMLMPFFILAGSMYMFFEQAVSNFEDAQFQNLEERFSLAELKNHFSDARPNINALLIQPGQSQRLDDLNEIHARIEKEIAGIVDSSTSPEKIRLLIGIGESWQDVYTAVQYPLLTETPPDEEGRYLAEEERVDQIQKDLDQVQKGFDRIDIVLTDIQSVENLKRARQLKEQQRLWIGLITVVAIILALLSAFLLSRSVFQNMRILIRGLESLSEGELDQRIEWHSQDEFGRVANAINLMAEKLAQSQQTLIEIATIDGLTGLLNRREFNRLLTIEVERSRRDSHPVAMVMIDIDHFKSINDTYGHQAGDDALQWVSSLIKREIRPGDIVARYGGEEFALILPNTNREETSAVAERIRHKMEHELVPIQKGLTISITASLGCAIFPFVGDSEELLLSAADRALYRAKKAGRNRIYQSQTELEKPEAEPKTEQSTLT